MKACNLQKPEQYVECSSSQGMIYYRIPHLKELGVELVFSTRLRKLENGFGENNMADPELRTGFLRSLGFDEENLITVRQVHGGNCIVVDGEGCIHGLREESDGIISADPAKILGISTADCLAIGLVARDQRLLALLHGGWRGLVHGIIGNSLDLMIQKYKVQPGSLVACLGPAIGPCCYPVGPELLDAFRNAYPYLENAVSKNVAGQNCMDLRKSAIQMLAKSGIKLNNIVSINLCTSCNNHLFYSYRKEGKSVGRLMAFMGWHP